MTQCTKEIGEIHMTTKLKSNVWLSQYENMKATSQIFMLVIIINIKKSLH